METFAWRPTTAKLAREPKLVNAKFGDGYEQRAALGMNNALGAWDLAWTELLPSTASAIDDFLVARGGHEAFLWASPKGTIRVVCKKWQVQGAEQSVTASASAMFEQVTA